VHCNLWCGGPVIIVSIHLDVHVVRSLHISLMQALEGTVRHIDFRDTFLDAAHVTEAFPNYSVQFVDDCNEEVQPDRRPNPPYAITFPPFCATTKQSALPEGIPEPPEGTIIVRGYTPVKSTPFPEQQPGRNNIRFNTEQLKVILSGMQPGLTMCVGPPGTGKTDTAVQVRAARDLTAVLRS
jgi:intron-binding protein aquarius